MSTFVSQGLGASSRRERLMVHRDPKEAGSACWGRLGVSSGHSSQIHFLPHSMMIIDVHNDGPGALQVPRVCFKSSVKEPILLSRVFGFFEMYPN